MCIRTLSTLQTPQEPISLEKLKDDGTEFFYGYRMFLYNWFLSCTPRFRSLLENLNPPGLRPCIIRKLFVDNND